jgi:hypothetical protein
MLYHGPFPAEFYRLLHRFIHAEHRLHKIMRRGRWRERPRALYEALRWAQMRVGLMAYVLRGA